MKITFKQVVLRVAAATGVLVGSSVVACSGTNDPGTTAPGPSVGGTGSTTGGMSTAGTVATGAGTGGASAGTGTGGSGTGGMCPGNQIHSAGGTAMTGMCACPAYASTFCADIPKCVSAMKDPDHCGDCMTKCGAMNACAAGACTPDLATFGEIANCGTLALVSTPAKLYVLSPMAGLSSIALPAGGAATPIAATLMGGTAFAVDATNAYVAVGKDLKRVKLADGVTDTLTTSVDTIYDVALDGAGMVYYATGGEKTPGVPYGEIRQVSVTATAGATAMVVATSADEGKAEGVAVSNGMVLYASADAFNLESDPVATEMHTKIGASQAGLIFGHRSVQADMDSVYWANNSLQMAKFTGDNHTGTTIASPIDGSMVTAFAVDSAKKMSYIATKDGSFEKSAFDKGNDEATWVARALPQVSSIVLDDTSVYLASACKILKSAR